MVRCQLSCQMDMPCDGGRIDSPEIFLIHPADKVVQYVGRDVLAVRRNSSENLVTIVHRGRSIPQQAAEKLMVTLVAAVTIE
jgi:hypothetical protein